jgi:hypothetical protein
MEPMQSVSLQLPPMPPSRMVSFLDEPRTAFSAAPNAVEVAPLSRLIASFDEALSGRVDVRGRQSLHLVLQRGHDEMARLSTQ